VLSFDFHLSMLVKSSGKAESRANITSPLLLLSSERSLVMHDKVLKLLLGAAGGDENG